MQPFISGADNVLAHSTPTLDRLGRVVPFWAAAVCARS